MKKLIQLILGTIMGAIVVGVCIMVPLYCIVGLMWLLFTVFVL